MTTTHHLMTTTMEERCMVVRWAVEALERCMVARWVDPMMMTWMIQWMMTGPTILLPARRASQASRAQGTTMMIIMWTTTNIPQKLASPPSPAVALPSLPSPAAVLQNLPSPASHRRRLRHHRLMTRFAVIPSSSATTTPRAARVLEER